MQLPITDPVLIFAVAMAILLFAPLLFERLRIPGIIGLIVAGAVLGPNAAGVLARDQTIVLLGTVGLLYLVFMAGLELDLNLFREYRRRSLIFGALSFGIPMLLAVGVMPLLGYGAAAALLLGSIIGSHTLLAYPIASRLGLAKNLAVTTVVGGTLVTDTLALAVLAVISGSMEGGLGAGFWVRLVGILGAYVALVLWGVPRLGRWFFRNSPGQGPAEWIFLMVVLFTSAYLAGVAGAQPIIGAFLAGLTLNRLIPGNSSLMNRVRFVGNALFVPFFLISVGMLMDARVLAGSARVWIIAGTLILLVNLGKLAAALIGERVFHYSRDEGILMFGLSVPQAAATLAVTFVGLEIGLFDEVVVNGVILMILVTIMIGPWLTERYGRRVALQEEQAPYDPGQAPQRILIPIANPATTDALLDLAFLIRGRTSEEPLHPLMVVREEGEEGAAQVAEAERMLGHAVIHAAAAEVPVVPLTRVDRNIARGIVRGIAETRSSVVVVGWDGKGAGGHGIFGTVLDQLLEQSKQLVLVVKLGHPLNTTRRLVLVLPGAIDHHPGFYTALATVKTMAGELGASALGLVVAGSAEHYRRLFDEAKPQVPSTWEEIPRWGALLPELAGRLQPDDLVVVMSARRGTLAWSSRLERLPSRLAGLVPESFIMIYPAQAVPALDETRTQGGGGETESFLLRALRPERIVVEMEHDSYRDALRTLLGTTFADRPSVIEDIVEGIAHNHQDFSAEISPGVVVPHARVRGLAEPMIFLGVSPAGIPFPHVTEPARLIFLLLSPAERPREHLEHLAQIARFVSTPQRIHDLLECRTADSLVRCLEGDHASI